MRKLIYTAILMIVLCCAANAQTVEVSQQFIDDANLAFKTSVRQAEELKAAYILIGKEQAEKAALREENDKLRAIKCNETTTRFKPLGWSIFKTTKKVCF